MVSLKSILFKIIIIVVVVGDGGGREGAEGGEGRGKGGKTRLGYLSRGLRVPSYATAYTSAAFRFLSIFGKCFQDLENVIILWTDYRKYFCKILFKSLHGSRAIEFTRCQ